MARQRITLLRLIAALTTTAAFALPAVPLPRWALGPFLRPADAHPVITPDPQAVFTDPILGKPVAWEALHTFNPAAIVRKSSIYVLYRAEDNSGDMHIGHHTSRLGLAESTDGLHFTRSPDPVFYPAKDAQQRREWPGGVEDPRIVESEDGRYVLTYTQWNRQTYTVGIATSTDLIHWTKYGPAFPEKPAAAYGNRAYKSAGILTRVLKGRVVAAQLRGKYWMYWGEGEIHLATSTDLIHWTPLTDAHGHPVVVLRKRAGRFDSSFPEVGPPPLLTANGILLIYNGKNSARGGDPHLGPNAYAAGQALFSPNDPARLLQRLDAPFFRPELPFEKTGQYAAGTTFAEGLALFHGKWFLYYGCADSMVGVATANGATTQP